MVVNSEAPKYEHNNQVNQADITSTYKHVQYLGYFFFYKACIYCILIKDMIFMHQINCTYCIIKATYIIKYCRILYTSGCGWSHPAHAVFTLLEKYIISEIFRSSTVLYHVEC